MPEKNKILPQEKLSSRERIERKVKSFDGRPFTIREINKLLRPRLGQAVVRYHLDNMVNNLYLEKFYADGQTRFMARDILRNVSFESNDAQEFFATLKDIAKRYREGQYVDPDYLLSLRNTVRTVGETLENAAKELYILHDCTDLWLPDNLVKRIGFLDDEVSSDQ